MLESIFSIANSTLMVLWIALTVSLFWPRLQRGMRLLGWTIAPLILAAVYTWLLVPAMGASDGSFSSLEQVALLFTNDRLLLAGWIHYLVFDFFVGTWIVSQSAQRRGWIRLIVVPCLFLTFMAGPLGLGLFLILNATESRSAP